MAANRKARKKGSKAKQAKPAKEKLRVGKRRAAAPRARAISAKLKGLTIAAEPPIDRDPVNLSKAFRDKLDAALAKLAAVLKPFKLVEGFRTTDRQQWLYGSGRPDAKPYGRPGAILTNADGFIRKSKHQGTGNAGSGAAADCYPTKDGNVYIPPSSDPVWKKYADAVEAEGLVAGHNFASIKDSPHAELG